MQGVAGSLAFALAALCAGVMGYAIQRGATCTVAAVDELIDERSGRRLLGLLEAALWVAGGLIVARSLHRLPALPPAYAISGWTVVGGALLGLGACINGACVFGAIGRFGSGEWVYLATPVGFYLGCLTVVPLFGVPMPSPLAGESPVLQSSAGIGVLFIAFALWRIARPWLGAGARTSARARWHEALAARIWSPHAATTVIAITFVALLLLVGAWAWTDVLAELARGMSAGVGARLLLAAALLAGATLGGWTVRRAGRPPLSGWQLLRCLAGGMLMGWGSLLLPGGNDSLVLVAMPLASPYAWLAFATMCATIAAARLAERTWRSRPAAP